MLIQSIFSFGVSIVLIWFFVYGFTLRENVYIFFICPGVVWFLGGVLTLCYYVEGKRRKLQALRKYYVNGHVVIVNENTTAEEVKKKVDGILEKDRAIYTIVE